MNINPNAADALVIFDLSSGSVPDNKMNININWNAIRNQTGDRELKVGAIIFLTVDGRSTTPAGCV